ncbi:MAG: flagellar export chaperone FliS [Christensenellales bacterium]
MRAFVEQEIMDMGPEELTGLLYEAFMERLRDAIKSLDDRNYIAVNYLLQGCNDILHRLGAGINYKAGIIADHLEALYNYCAERLIEANLRKDKSMMEDVLKIMGNLTEGWNKAMESIKMATPIDNRLDFYENHLYCQSSELDLME